MQITSLQMGSGLVHILYSMHSHQDGLTTLHPCVVFVINEYKKKDLKMS